MADPSVRTTKRADELERGDWVLDLASPTAASKVLAAYPYSDGDDRALVVYEDPDDRPAALHFMASTALLLATDAEITAVQEGGRRYAVASHLRALAMLFDDTILPVSDRYSSPPALSFHRHDLAEVQLVADKLGVGIEVDSAGRHSAFFRPAGKDSLVTAEWFTYVNKAEPEPPLPAVRYAGSPEATRDAAARSTLSFTCNWCPNPVVPSAEFHPGGQLGHVADPTGLSYSREAEPDDPRPVSPGRVPPHTGAMVDGNQLVDETPAEPIIRYFSFGHGQTDPETGESLVNKYVTVFAPTDDACREAMFASKYRDRWAFEYVPHTASANEWISQWTEHDRIVVEADLPPDVLTVIRPNSGVGGE